MATMSEREKRLLKRQQAVLEKEKEELRKKMEKKRNLIKALQEEKRKEEGKSEDLDRDPISPSDQRDVDLQANRIEQSPKLKGTKAEKEKERIASGGRSLTESSTAEFNTLDEVGESPAKHQDLTTKQKEVTTPRIDLDFEAR